MRLLAASYNIHEIIARSCMDVICFLHFITLENRIWMICVFGGLLIFTAVRMLVAKKEKKIEVEKNIAERVLRECIPTKLKIRPRTSFFIEHTICNKIIVTSTSSGPCILLSLFLLLPAVFSGLTLDPLEFQYCSLILISLILLQE